MEYRLNNCEDDEIDSDFENDELPNCIWEDMCKCNPDLLD